MAGLKTVQKEVHARCLDIKAMAEEMGSHALQGYPKQYGLYVYNAKALLARVATLVRLAEDLEELEDLEEAEADA